MIGAYAGQTVFQSFAHSHRSCSRSASTVRGREGLVQVDVHHVKAHIAGATGAQHRVEVGTIVVHQCAALVHHLCYFGDAALKESQCVGVGHHHGSHLFIEQFLEMSHIHSAICQALHLNDIQSAYRGRGGIGAMGRIGHDDLGSLGVAPLFVIGTYHHQSCQLAVSSSKGFQREGCQSGDGA